MYENSVFNDSEFLPCLFAIFWWKWEWTTTKNVFLMHTVFLCCSCSFGRRYLPWITSTASTRFVNDQNWPKNNYLCYFTNVQSKYLHTLYQNVQFFKCHEERVEFSNFDAELWFKMSHLKPQPLTVKIPWLFNLIKVIVTQTKYCSKCKRLQNILQILNFKMKYCNVCKIKCY